MSGPIMPPMRLNAYLARAGVASRRGADELIKAGRVTVNGEAGQLNTFVESRDRVEVDGWPVELQPLAYVLLHKPAGVVTTARDPQGRRTVVELGRAPFARRSGRPPRRRHDRRAPARRTTAARAQARSPALRGREGLRGRGRGRAFRRGARAAPVGDRARRRADRARAGPAARSARGSSSPSTRAASTRSSACCAAVGHPVRRLHRSRYAGLTLDGLEPRRWRELAPDEVGAPPRGRPMRRGLLLAALLAVVFPVAAVAHRGAGGHGLCLDLLGAATRRARS